MKKYSVSVEIRKMQTNTQVYLAVRLATIKSRLIARLPVEKNTVSTYDLFFLI